MNPETHLKTDILIVGKGVSGLVLNYLLSKKGIKTIVLDRMSNTQEPILAETIPPSTLQLLDNLKLLSIFENCATRTYGYQSKWHNETIQEQSFFNQNPFKYGLKLDKRKLLLNLIKETQTENITYNHLLNIKYKNEKTITSIKIDKEIKTIESDLIIDATGRKRAILKKLKVASKTFDENLAFITYVPKIGSDLKYGFITESFENGWGTVSNLNETTNIISLYTEKNTTLHKKLSTYSNWKKILYKTQILKEHLPSQGNFKVFGKQANSSIINKIYSNYCLAVGDAAIAFDPISSHGISNAIFCASEATNVIDLFYKTNNLNVFKTYEEKLYTIFYEYLHQKEKLFKVNKTLIKENVYEA